MTPIPNLTDYATSRRTLLGAAEQAGASLGEYAHPERGPDGGPLATDTARFGAPVGDARDVVFVISGVHGVEGHAGNGLQQRLVDSGRLSSLPAGMAVVIVHAVNPYGFAWSRRVDHHNIDVNRNFLDYGAAPDNPLYAEIDPLLNPDDADLDPTDLSYIAEIADFIGRVGDTAAMHAISGGQYSHPTGIQFGGQHRSWSRATLEQVWTDHLPGAHSAVCLDIHTGLGPEGRLTVFQTADETEPAAQLGASLYSESIWHADRTVEDPLDHGLLGPGFDAWANGRLDTATFVLEFGTHDTMHVLNAFRADNWAHHHVDPAGERGQQVAQLMRDQLFIDDEGWRGDVADGGGAAIDAMLDAVASGAGAR